MVTGGTGLVVTGVVCSVTGSRDAVVTGGRGASGDWL